MAEPEEYRPRFVAAPPVCCQPHRRQWVEEMRAAAAACAADVERHHAAAGHDAEWIDTALDSIPGWIHGLAREGLGLYRAECSWLLAGGEL